MSRKIRFINNIPVDDADGIYVIDDENVGETTTYSSKKIEEAFAEVSTQIKEIGNSINAVLDNINGEEV